MDKLQYYCRFVLPRCQSSKGVVSALSCEFDMLITLTRTPCFNIQKRRDEIETSLSSSYMHICRYLDRCVYSKHMWFRQEDSYTNALCCFVSVFIFSNAYPCDSKTSRRSLVLYNFQDFLLDLKLSILIVIKINCSVIHEIKSHISCNVNISYS